MAWTVAAALAMIAAILWVAFLDKIGLGALFAAVAVTFFALAFSDRSRQREG
jgi:hypothetical protein